MTESQSVSKRQKSDYDSVHDRLSDLPLSIIHTILSSLAIEDAVRTSILSREWRYTWTGLPNLEFISNADGNQDKKTKSEERLKDFISYALSVHKGSLHKFKLDAVLEEPCPNLDEWLIRLSTKDIRQLRLMTKCPLWLSVHSSIYSCNKLIRLHLVCCDLGPPPSTFNGFLLLRTLQLHWVKISNATFEILVSNCPLLKSCQLLRQRRFEKDSMIRIHAPNLKYLRLQGPWTEMSVNAPLLSRLSVTLDAKELQRGPLLKSTNFLGGFTNLQKLVGLGWFTKFLSIWMESWNPNPLVFHRLGTIALNNVDFGDVKQQRVLARLFVGAPNLHGLAIVARTSSETQDEHFSGFGFESNFRMEKLRVVEMVSVGGLLPETKLIEFLLERSPLLKSMRVCHTERLGTEEIKNLTDKILGCTRASESAKILISEDQVLRGADLHLLV